MTDAITPLLEIAIPLVLGALAGHAYQAVGFPWVLSRLEGLGLSRLVSPRAMLVNSLLAVALWLFLAVWSHPSHAPEALAWFTHHPGLLPFTPTPSFLRGVFYVATFFCAYTLAAFPHEPVSAKK